MTGCNDGGASRVGQLLNLSFRISTKYFNGNNNKDTVRTIFCSVVRHHDFIVGLIRAKLVVAHHFATMPVLTFSTPFQNVGLEQYLTAL